MSATTLTPLTRLQLDKVIKAAWARARTERAIATKLTGDPDKAHYAWRATNAARWWCEFADRLALDEALLNAEQRVALGYLMTDLKIKRPKSGASA